jgi:hypothetical protein
MKTMATKAPLLLLLLAASMLSIASALYSSSGPVVELTDANFEAKVKAAGIMMVEVSNRVKARASALDSSRH